MLAKQTKVLNNLRDKPYSRNNSRRTNFKYGGSFLLIHDRHKSQPLIVFGQLQVAFTQITVSQAK